MYRWLTESAGRFCPLLPVFVCGLIFASPTTAQSVSPPIPESHLAVSVFSTLVRCSESGATDRSVAFGFQLVKPISQRTFLVSALAYGRGRMGIPDSGYELGYSIYEPDYGGQTGGPYAKDVADRGVKNLRCSVGGLISCLQFRGGFVGAGMLCGFNAHSETLIYTSVLLSGRRSVPLEYSDHSTLQTFAEFCLRVQKRIGRMALAIEAAHEIRLAEVSFDRQQSHLEFDPFRMGLMFSCPLALLFRPPRGISK